MRLFFTLGHSAIYAGPLSPTAPRVHVICWAMYARDAGPEPTGVNFGKVSRHDITKNVALLRDRGDSPSRWKHLETTLGAETADFGNYFRVARSG